MVQGRDLSFTGMLVLILLFANGSALAANENCVDASTDLLVWVKPSSVQVPGIDSLYETSRVTFNSEEMEISLSDLGVEAIGVGLPEMLSLPQYGTRSDGEQVRLIDYSNVFRFKFAPGTDLQAAAASLEGMPNVLHVDRVSFLEFSSVYPNDPAFVKGDQWAHSNWGQYNGSAGKDMHTPAAWSISKGTGIIVGLIDKGATGLNPDLAGRFTSASDATWDETALSNPGHGFLVAGVIGATVNNREGIAGVAWGAQMISENIEEADCLGDKNTWSSIVPPKIRHALTNGARVLNNSYEIRCTNPSIPYADFGVRTALADAYKLDRVVVASMGNNRVSETQYPAGFGNNGLSEHGVGVIAVGATYRTDIIWEGSNTGNHIDVVAPGADIMTTTAFTPAYSPVTGTSFAAPAVSGLAALLLAHDGTLSNDDVERLIKYSADPKSGGLYSVYGEGRINARRALEYTAPTRLYRDVSTLGGSPGAPGNFNVNMFFQGAPAVDDNGTPDTLTGHYCGYLREVLKDVTVSGTGFIDQSQLKVWARGTRNAPGTSLDLPSFGVGFAELANTPTINSSTGDVSFQLRTFVFQITARTENGGNCGTTLSRWVPRRPQDVQIAYSILDERESPVPSIAESFFVPQADDEELGVVEGQDAIRNFRACPNNDGGASLFGNARIKVVARDAAGTPIPGISAADIQVRLSGGTPAQGFASEGADSVIANGTYNAAAHCPDLFAIEADGPTDATGTTYITFTGAGGSRDAGRKWGHFDSELPVFIMGTKIQGRLTSESPTPEYRLRIRNFDFTNTYGLTTQMNEGEWVDGIDWNYVVNHAGNQPGPLNYWADFDTSGDVSAQDFNMFTYHNQHACDYPFAN